MEVYLQLPKFFICLGECRKKENAGAPTLLLIYGGGGVYGDQYNNKYS